MMASLHAKEVEQFMERLNERSENEIQIEDTMLIVTENTEKYLKELKGIWQDIGYTPENIHARERVVIENIKQLLSDMLSEEKGNQQQYIDRVEALLKESGRLSKELGVDLETLTGGLEKLTLINVEETLNRRLEKWRLRKQEIISRYKDLLKMEESLCISMGLLKRPAVKSGVPTEEYLEGFSVYINTMRQEETELKQQYYEIREKIQSIRLELEAEPDTTFHKIVAEDDNFCLSSENMLMLKQLHQTMEQTLERAKAQSMELREKLTDLWERLQEDYVSRENFLSSYPGYSKTTINGLKNEIRRCEEKKRQNIKQFVENIRLEVHEWWEKCCLGEEQKRSFRAYYLDCYTEDLLELHELEVQRLREYHTENLDIISLAKKHETLWNKMIELEERAHDPNRLFGNRGGQLLKEEKERKTIQKDLPKLEAELQYYLQQYEEKNKGKQFLFQGQDLQKIIKDRWNNFHEQKEQEKIARKRKDTTEVESKSARTFSSTKRKIAPTNTPTPVPSKVSKLTATKEGRGPPTKTGGKVVRQLLKQTPNKQNKPGSSTKRPQKPKIDSGENSIMSYTNFQDHLEKLSEEDLCRSSVVPGRTLRERNVIQQAAACKTPTKPPRTLLKNTPTPKIFRTPQTRKSPTTTPRGAATAPRLAAVRGRLPIII